MDQDINLVIIDTVPLFEQYETDIIKLDAEFFIWVSANLQKLDNNIEETFQKLAKKSLSNYLVEKEQEKLTGIPFADTHESQVRVHSTSGNFTILLMVNKQVIGRIGLQKIDSKKALVRKTYVQPTYRGNNFGEILIEKLKSEAIARNFEKLKLGTFQFMKSAIKLYLKTGFEVCEYNNELGVSIEDADQIGGFAMELSLEE